MKTLLLCLSVCAVSASAQQNTCVGPESGVEAEIGRLPVANDDMGLFRTIGDQAMAALRQCRQSARLWYLAARSAEVLENPSNGQAFAAEGGLKQIIADALSHAPQSAPVLTVAARVQRSSAFARKAVALDSGYQPVRRTLAELLAKEGSIKKALRLTTNPRSDAMRLTRARVLLTAKRPAEAVAEIRKIPRSASPDELSPVAEMHHDTQEVLGFALLDLKKTAQTQEALRAAGSVAAQHYLAGRK